MPESTDPLADEVRASGPGLVALVDQAQRIWQERSGTTGAGRPGWRPFEDAFPTFYQFTNRPR